MQGGEGFPGKEKGAAGVGTGMGAVNSGEGGMPTLRQV